MSNTKVRRYCFTLNNPEFEPTAHTFDEFPKLAYAVYQLESGEHNTPHIQGYLHFDSPVRMSWIKSRCDNLLSRAHFEPAGGSVDDNYRYCTKEDGRLAGPWEYGVKPRQGQRTDLDAFCTALTEGKTDRELLEQGFAKQLLLYGGKCKQIRKLLPPRVRRMPRRIVLCGEPGTGKTTWVKENFDADDIFWLSNDKWWDGYFDQKVVVLDEFKGWIPRQTWLKLYDDSPLQVEVKGDMLWANPDVVITISNYMPELWWKDMRQQWKAVTRRMDEFYVPGNTWGEMVFYDRDVDQHRSGWDRFAELTGYVPSWEPQPRVE